MEVPTTPITPQTTPDPESAVTKPKKINLSDEERQRRSDRMKALAKSRNDLLKKQKAERISTPAPEPTPVPAPAPPAPVSVPTPDPKMLKKSASKKTPKQKKKVVVVESSESEDYDGATTEEDDSETEVIYVTKKPTKDAKMTKPKKAREPPAVVLKSEPEIKVRFF